MATPSDFAFASMYCPDLCHDDFPNSPMYPDLGQGPAMQRNPDLGKEIAPASLRGGDTPSEA